jgi:hypothetical protein
MVRAHRAAAVLLLSLGGCSTEPEHLMFRPLLQSFASSEWLAPTNLGPVVNSSFNDIQPAISSDGLSLYFSSNRDGGAGGNDIWVAHRECEECPWAAPNNVAALNSAFVDGGPSLVNDGHVIFFHSSRPEGPGSNDIWMAHRTDIHNDFGWGEPRLLGSEVNTEGLENKPFYLHGGEEGAGTLYFHRASPTNPNDSDLYYALVGRDGDIRGEAVLIAALSSSGTNEQGPTLRIDGREILFSSNKAGGVGLSDLWTSTRRSVHHEWLPATNLGSPVNSTVGDQTPSLSSDGRILVFDSARPDGSGGRDIWISTRSVNGRP